MTDERDTAGRYDAIARVLLATLNADAVLVVVVGGDMGTGASSAAISPAAQLQLAKMMRETAMADFQAQHARDIMGRG